MKKGNKFNAKRTSYEGIAFDSEAELQRYQQLKSMQHKGEIQNLRVHGHPDCKFLLVPKQKRDGRAIRELSYIPDFVYIENDTVIYEDVKGMITPEFKIKVKLVYYMFPKAILRFVVKRQNKKQGIYFKEITPV